MDQLRDILGGTFMLSGMMFFIAGTVGLLRFPDVYTRLHALTKADNLGLGLIIISLLITSDSISEDLKLVLIWLLVIMSGSSASYLVARTALHRGVEPWRKQ